MRVVLLLIILFFCGPLNSEVATQSTLTEMIPMRDGTLLPTDLYFPDSEAKDLPCILIRTTYDRKNPNALCYVPLSKQGYVVAVQNTRSYLDPEGKVLPYLDDGWGELQDGYDTVEWLAKSEYTNGKIGTLGFSAMGITQLMMAPTTPPSLKCQYIGVAAGSLYHHAMFNGGQFLKSQVEGWLNWCNHDPGVHGFLCNQIFYNDLWQSLDTVRQAHKVTVPAIHYGGWYDIFLEGTIDSFLARQHNGGEGARGKQKLVIGPWTHYWPKNTMLGDFSVPQQGQQPPIDVSPKRWFDHYLKEEGNGVDDMPAVTYYVMGPFDKSSSAGNVWRHSDVWPVPCEERKFYLSAEKKLTTNRKELQDRTFAYDYNPHHPVPTVGGRNLCIEAGPKDQCCIEERDDVLVFTSENLEEDLEVTGQIFASIFFSSDQQDTDLAVRLCDVYPDGRSILVADGIFRTGMMQLIVDQKDLEASGPMEVEVDLWSTSFVFAKGHRIRVSLSSSNYPRYERNFNVGLLGSHSGAVNVAHNQIFVGHRWPSRLILPVVTKEN